MWQFAIVMLVIMMFVIGLVAGLNAVDKGNQKTPEELLAARFAKGEIDEPEYTRRLAILRYGPPLELPD